MRIDTLVSEIYDRFEYEDNEPTKDWRIPLQREAILKYDMDSEEAMTHVTNTFLDLYNTYRQEYGKDEATSLYLAVSTTCNEYATSQTELDI